MFTKFVTKVALTFAIFIGLVGFAGAAQAGGNNYANCPEQTIFIKKQAPHGTPTIKVKKSQVEKVCSSKNGVVVRAIVHKSGKHPVNECNTAENRCWLNKSIRVDNDNWETDDGQKHVYEVSQPRNDCRDKKTNGRLHHLTGDFAPSGPGRHFHSGRDTKGYHSHEACS